MGFLKTFGLSLGIFVTCVVTLFFVVLFLVQEKLIFEADALPETYQFQFHLPFEERRIAVGDSLIDSLFFRVPQAKGLVVYFHGNAGNLSSWGFVAETLARKTGANVWILDYPGYGKSGGAIYSEIQLRQIAEAFFELAQKEASADNLKLFIYGRSIGNGLATYVASGHKVDGLILESPSYSLMRLVRRKVIYVPYFLLKYQLPLNEWLKNVRSPVLIVHGRNDQAVPVQHAIDLKTRVLPSARLVIVDSESHIDLTETEAYWNAVVAFLH